MRINLENACDDCGAKAGDPCGEDLATAESVAILKAAFENITH